MCPYYLLMSTAESSWTAAFVLRGSDPQHQIESALVDKAEAETRNEKKKTTSERWLR